VTWEVLGLPLHPLVVHAVVVLVPLVTAGLALAVLRAGWSERLRLVLAVLAVGAALAGLVSRLSGQWLLPRVPGSAEVARHASLGTTVPWLVALSAVLVVAWAWQDAHGRPSRALAVAALVAGVVATGWTVAVGHSGAVAVWG
jgi:hypothetical protein